jgi:hypothetical protein
MANALKRKREGPQSKDTHPLPSFKDNFALVYTRLYAFILAMYNATTDKGMRTSLVELSITWIVSVYSFEKYTRKLIGLVGDVGVVSFHQELPAIMKLLYEIRRHFSE